jgi:multidrug resistance protein
LITFFSNRLKSARAGDAGKLTVLMFTAFIDMVGALMVIPLLPFYAQRLGANAFMVMILVAAFSAMQLLSAPFWGRISDRYGRKPVLLTGLAGSAVAYVVFAYADTYWLLLVSRLVQGAGGGTVGVLQAYVADAVAPRNRTRALGWLSAATNAGVVLGPAIGSLATHLGPEGPGLIAAGLCVLNTIFAWKYLTESHDTAARAKARHARRPAQIVWRVAWSHPGEPASRLIWMYAVAIGAYYGVTAILILLLNRRFGVCEQNIGFFFTYMGGLSIVIRIFLLGPVVDRLGEARTSRLGAALLAAGLALLPLTRPLELPGILEFGTLGLAVALLPLGSAFLFPAVTAFLSRLIGEHERGLYMGVQQTYGGIARVIYPPLAGLAWDHLGTSVPFWASAVMVAATILLGLGLEAPSHLRGPTAEQAAKAVSGEREAAVAD